MTTGPGSLNDGYGPLTFQGRVREWAVTCFGRTTASDVVERHHRLLEEALELVQATGCTREEALQLVDYVYGREVGDVRQEVGGVMVTLAALCAAWGISMDAEGNFELTRCWENIDRIREKHKRKPRVGPLPEDIPGA